MFHLAKRDTATEAGGEWQNGAIIGRYLARDFGMLALAGVGLVVLLRRRHRLGAGLR